LGHDTEFVMDLAKIALLEAGVQFDLVERWRHPGLVDDRAQVFLAEIRYADGLRLAFVAQLDQRLPGFDEKALVGAGLVDQ